MKPTQIIGLAGKVLGIGNLSVSQIEFPLENYSTSVTLPSKGFVIKFDESSLDILHDFIFKNNFIYSHNLKIMINYFILIKRFYH